MLRFSLQGGGRWVMFMNTKVSLHAVMQPRREYHRRPPPATETSWYHASHESQSHSLYPVWISTIEYIKLFNIVARDLPGGKRIRIINMRAQHITFNKAIKTVLKRL